MSEQLRTVTVGGLAQIAESVCAAVCRKTWEGWAFLATVIDCATRKVIGWAVGDNYRTPLITSAIQMAARNVGLAEGAVFHSDRGSLGITRAQSSPPSWKSWVSGSRWAVPGHVSIMHWRNHSMRQ